MLAVAAVCCWAPGAPRAHRTLLGNCCATHARARATEWRNVIPARPALTLGKRGLCTRPKLSASKCVCACLCACVRVTNCWRNTVCGHRCRRACGVSSRFRFGVGVATLPRQFVRVFADSRPRHPNCRTARLENSTATDCVRPPQPCQWPHAWTHANSSARARVDARAASAAKPRHPLDA